MAVPACAFCQEDWTDDDVDVIVESAATINSRNIDSENSREFGQDSESTPIETVYSSDEEPDVIAQSHEVKRVQFTGCSSYDPPKTNSATR